ncbi:caspase family protein [Dyella sp. C11]|uniref:caspase family protein n=1 Tax=Dyella sp. C11 TaxID=2126991 RepID=UPI000D646FEC|nr:caspase family protein [Dyella sp. C11]
MRALISIGCNHYDHISDLEGAELDARRMYEALMRQEVGDYDPSLSALLLSPTTDQVRAELLRILPLGKLETLTIYFAGHGDTHAGSFYMCLRDTVPTAMSLTALSLADLFRNLNEFSPSQSNVMIDACRSGGLVADLGALLKPEFLGDAGSPGITLVATSAQNQYAGETGNGGIGTNAILDCIEGRAAINDFRPTLDLTEIGRHIHSLMPNTKTQQPVVWGLNLVGAPGFCRNPRYGSDPTARLRDVLQAWPADSEQVIRNQYNELWRAYTSIDVQWSAREFTDIISQAFAALSEQPAALVDFCDRLSAAALERAALSRDQFRGAEVCSSLAVSLLPFCEDTRVARHLNSLLNQAGAQTLTAAHTLLADLELDRYALLTKRNGGLSDLYVLPYRLLKVLGWTAGSMLLTEDAELQAAAQIAFGKLLKASIEGYANALALMTDAQAPYMAIALHQAKEANLELQGEQLFGLLYNSFLEAHGNLAAVDIPPESVLDYLDARRLGDFSNVHELIERPGQSLTVLLRCAKLWGLEDIANNDLWELDRISFLAYMTPDFSQYAQESMENGENYVWTIGRDVCKVSDLTGSWPLVPLPADNLYSRAAVAASLLFPDRVPWFLLR